MSQPPAANLPPSTSQELTPFVNAPGEQYVDTRILDGKGVSAEFIKECAGHNARFRQVDLSYEATFPRDRDGITYQFFQGEALPNRVNLVNNPMQLIRPRVLASPSDMVDQGIGRYVSSPQNSARSNADRGLSDDKYERTYVQGVQSYEELFVAVLEATNMPAGDEAAQHVREALNATFKRHNTFTQILERETPAGWLIHAVLATVLHPSNEITPAGRVRVLSLLNMFTPQELTVGFTSGETPNPTASFFGSGLHQAIKQRIPHTLCEPHERSLDEHKKWQEAPAIAAILGPVKQRDYRLAANNVVAHPREAVQLAILSLMLYGKEQFGVELLRQIPALDRNTLAVMFGPQATFYADNRISNKLSDQVSEGLGTKIDPTLSFDGLGAKELAKLPRDELVTLMSAALLRLRTAEELAASLVMSAGSVRAETTASRSDPEGYCDALGLDPRVLDRYNPEQLAVLLAGAHRAMSKLHHPETGNLSDPAQVAARTAWQQKINEARQKLLDGAFRATYGKPRNT